MDDNRTALVLGATGGVAGAVAANLLRRGWTVRAMHRNPAAAHTRLPGPEPEWVAGDAMSATDVLAAARGTSLIVHADNPPGCRNWDTLVLPTLDDAIAASTATGARTVLPGTVHNYGPDALPLGAEDAAHHPVSRKGATRVEVEQRAAERNAAALVARAGDDFGPGAGGGWFSQCLVKPGRPVTAITDPGKAGRGQQCAYLPDVAETMASLDGRSTGWSGLRRFHMDGHWDADGTPMVGATRDAVALSVPVKRFFWWLARLGSPAVPLFREMAGTLGAKPERPWTSPCDRLL